jgi:hypothetical protein
MLDLRSTAQVLLPDARRRRSAMLRHVLVAGSLAVVPGSAKASENISPKVARLLVIAGYSLSEASAEHVPCKRDAVSPAALRNRQLVSIQVRP